MGKIKLAEARGQEIPRGWVVDSEGDLTTDPKKIQGGALLPLGGPGEGYKGTALAAMGEVFCGILTGLGFGVEPTGRHNDGCFLIAIKVEAFRPLLTFRKDVADFARYLKDTPPAKGSSGVLYPGEVEHLSQRKRAAEGVEIEEATWKKLGALAAEGGIAERLGFA
jgi:uncharacterized oxidoreductase